MDCRYEHLLGDQQDWLLMDRCPQKGYSLIELMVVVALFALLLALAMPSIRDMIANARVRTAAEGMLNGMQLARAEAVRLNTPVNLNIRADGIGWDIVLTSDTAAPPTALHTRAADVGVGVTTPAPAQMTTPTLTDTPTSVSAPSLTFNGWGTMAMPNGGVMATAAAFAIRYSSPSGTRAMCVAIIANTPRMCDPQRTTVLNPAFATDPQACYIPDPNNPPPAVIFIPGC